ncbi:MATE family efflux transporter [Butyrivibrio proteoclasticus]|uniref:MATE family efflux transporter n=1 Tax=Butyrivibrio proteoclasticus TaxID=43305 RepID=UPI00068628B4|nr:MATE family efflux transporter [Butyrivibrio proteoclasticus]
MNTFETNNREEAIKVKFGLKEALIGDRQFYSRVAMIVIPMIIQNTLTNIVGLLDNFMVGRLGSLPMSSVAIVNQILFIFYLCIWGSLAGAGIYSTQFFGKGDMDGVRYAIRFKLITAVTIFTIAFFILSGLGSNIISLYIAKETPPADALATLNYGRGYLKIMIIGLIPFSLTQCYASAMRESGKTRLPMIASMVAMVVNFCFNLLLIFGLLGFPRMGVYGAAIATVISRFVEFSIVVFGAHKRNSQYSFFKGLYRNFRIPKELVFPILLKCLPLLCNEFLWSLAQAALLKAYSERGIAIIAAMNISGTISQIFNEVFLSIGNSAGIVIGQELGAGRLVNARRSAYRMSALTVASTFIMGSLLAIAAPIIPNFYNVEPEIKTLATSYIFVVSLVMPIISYAHVSYFTIRSGGKTFVTFLFDSCFSWVVSVPEAYILSRFTTLPVVYVYAIVMYSELIKCVVGFLLIRSGVWVRNIVHDK